ncbi:MAG TPA: 5-formyltetrahydrofolate cyclo-ligase [Candidatus Paceibacterota bacterium]|nr:5-formyltetrahydrofolate cyclo-ligase [Candidatus Paceibacterota bacterium]
MEELQKLLAPYRAFITYTPLRTEVYAHALFDTDGAVMYLIEPRASLDPKEEALAAMKTAGDLPTAILVPGRRFDASGTRHGQGGGWYDRFLARVPSEWLRVGFCFDDQFSLVPLVRNAWDQPVDYICVIDRKSGGMKIYASGRLVA